MDAIAAYDLTKEYYGQPVLAGLNLQVPQGEAFACVGEKSCGKTTLVRLLSGLDRPTSGECSVLGLSPLHEPQRLHIAWLEGGKRKVVEAHETADESPADADGTVWEEDEEFSEEWGEQLSGEDFQNAHGEEPEPGEEPEGESEEV